MAHYVLTSPSLRAKENEALLFEGNWIVKTLLAAALLGFSFVSAWAQTPWRTAPESFWLCPDTQSLAQAILRTKSQMTGNRCEEMPIGTLAAVIERSPLTIKVVAIKNGGAVTGYVSTINPD